ncbi:MAG: hypothetical protein ACXV5U_01945 [Ilumatobacteraceae bacterium]
MIVMQFAFDDDAEQWLVVSPQLPSLSASAARLVDCQRLGLRLLEARHIDLSRVRWVLGSEQRVVPAATVRSLGERSRRRAALIR